jgi:hypothetical protein
MQLPVAMCCSQQAYLCGCKPSPLKQKGVESAGLFPPLISQDAVFLRCAWVVIPNVSGQVQYSKCTAFRPVEPQGQHVSMNGGMRM